MASEEEKLLKEAKKLPWEQRLLHKNWKVRSEANIDLASLCDSITDPKDPRLKEFGPLFKKMVADSNAAVQEKALDALITFLKAADSDAARYAKEVCDAVVAKCLTGRPKTVEKAQAVFLLFVELEAAEVFLESMEKAVKNKVAKAVVPAIDVMFQALSEFGAKVVLPKRILKMLPELFHHSDQNVRASSKGLTLELCRWIGKEAVKSILFEKMQNTMKKELETELANVSGTAKPTRKIRSEQDKDLEQELVLEASEAGPLHESVDNGPLEIDEYDLVDPVDILTPLEKSGFWNGVKATKWSERRDAVAELTKLASTKRISPGDFTEICRTIKKLVGDVNIAVSVEAIQVIGNLAKGLRNHFSSNSKYLLPVLLEKLKEKKPTLIEALTQTLQAINKSGCLTLPDIIEEIKAAVKNKVPLVRSQTLNWVKFCIETSNKATVLKLHKDYVPICIEVRCLNDGTPEVRDSSFSALAAIAKIVGMKPLERSLDKLDEIRKKKLSDMIGPTNTVTETKSKPNPSAGGSVHNATVKSAASMLTGKKPAQSTTNTKKSEKAKSGNSKKTEEGSKAALPIVTEDIEPIDLSLAEIEERLNKIINSDTISQLKSGVWKERLEGITERVADIKTRADSTKCLMAFCESVGPTFVFGQMYKIMKEHKNPRVLSEGILWMVSAVEDFGVSNLNIKETGLQSNTAATQKATVKLIGILHKFVGEDIKGFLGDVNPTLLNSLEAEFKKNPYEIRLESIESINKILQVHKKIQPTCTAELFGALKGRLHDSNKNIVMATLSTIGCLATALGPSVEKSSNGILTDVLKCLGDNKKHMGEFTLNTLDLWIAATHLDKMVPYIVTTLTDSKTGAEGRKYLFDWLLKQLPKLNDSSESMLLLVKPVASALIDKSSEIKKSAESVLSEIIKACGKDAVTKCLKDLPKPVLLVVSERLNPPCMPHDSSGSTLRISTNRLVKSGPLNVNKQGLISPTGQELKLPKRPSSSKGASMRGPSSVISLQDASDSSMRVSSIKTFKPIQMISKQGLSNRPSSSKGANMRALNAAQDSSNSSTKVSNTTNKPNSKQSKLGNRPSSSKGAAMRNSGSINSLQDLAVQSGPLFNISNSNKEKRERSFAHKFKFDDIRPEQLQQLENDILKHVREDVSQRLLSKDFKKQVDGIDILQKALASSGKEMIELLDILLRWFVLRLCESNTTILMKVFEFLHELFDILKAQTYSFTEAEAEMFLPCLIEKAGHNNEKVKVKARELVKQTIGIYSASKLLNYILESLRSKNNRTKIECADLIGFLIDTHFYEINGQLKCMKIIAGLIAERDSELRKSALNTLAIAYENIGDDVWMYIGKVADQQKSMIDERFKWKAREMKKKSSKKKPNETLSQAAIEEDMESMVSVDTCMERLILHAETGPTNLRNELDIVVLAELEQSVEGMKIIFNELRQAMADPKSNVIKELVEESDRLVSCFTKLVPSSFNHSISSASSRPCKYVLNILLLVFQMKSLASAVSERTLEELINELLVWLLDKRVSQMNDGSQLYNALNVLVPKILDNADKTLCFVVLLKLLKPAPTLSDSLAMKIRKFSDIVLICLTKMTNKVVENKIHEVDLDRIFQSICSYFNALEPEEMQISPVVDMTQKLLLMANSKASSESGSSNSSISTASLKS
ncbi:hypothetical protein LUZ60_011071 [Juncus effusus]|nr:hypothetical protein LUZ60_011071 [Juncus effusus]